MSIDSDMCEDSIRDIEGEESTVESDVESDGDYPTLILKLRKPPLDNDENFAENTQNDEPKLDTPEEKPASGEWKCPICMEDIHDPVVTRCGHVFCKRCIYEWLNRSNICPTCNRHNLKHTELLSIRGQGFSENRPEPDNTLVANSIPIRIMRIIKGKILTINTLVSLFLLIVFYLSLFLKMR